MALLKAEADKLSNNQLVQGVVEEIITEDAWYEILDFVTVNGKALVFNRENTLATVDFYLPNEIIEESASTFEMITTQIKALIGDVDVDNFLQVVESDTNDQKGTQIELKAKALGRRYRETAINGNVVVNPQSFDGLVNLVTAGQTIWAGNGAANGAALSFADMDILIDYIRSAPVACIIMNERTIRAYKTLLRGAGGVDSAMLQMPYFSRPVLTFGGDAQAVPILKNNYITTTETRGTTATCTSIYAMAIGKMVGVTGLMAAKQAGIVVEPIGNLETKDANRTRLKWYCGLTLWSTLGLARLAGLTN